ncbi:nucleotidyl transferase AbiEii/AbiGii toxin family protein [Gardnerella sp. KA00288]|uniref:nucleotidyl transferase AbiEii/AbiGii toxin family protein n=2 Tax=Gardnerella TaxID=2701 RepID=UPI003BAB496F
MNLTDAQIRGRIKNLAEQNNADPRVLMRLYMMERYLERVSVSKYHNNFIVKGGVLVTSLLGISMRSTMDIDTTIQNYDLSLENTKKMIEDISSIDIDDGVDFTIKSVMKIMDDMEYPGIRFALDSRIGRMVTPIKIDVSTGATITPRAIEYDYKLMLEDRSISILSYNIETVFAEKLQTILSRGILNTRMRDFYDVHVLFVSHKRDVNREILKRAFHSTCENRKTENIIDNLKSIYESIACDEKLSLLWTLYQRKYSYAKDIDFGSALLSLDALLKLLE